MPAFHRGELRAQTLAGTRGVADELSPGLSTALPSIALDTLLTPLRLLALTTVAPTGAVWVSLPFGPPGFVRSTAPQILHVDLAGLSAQDVLRQNLASAPVHTKHPVATLALDLQRRRRYRTNGLVAPLVPDATTLDLHVKEAFPNCPKYIQTRSVTSATASLSPTPAHVATTVATALAPADIELVQRADTLFLGTHSATGADVNHRGGQPGFVRVLKDTELYWADYRGNGMFQSFGNLQEDDRAGLAFLDFTTGRLLQLSGRATVVWTLDGSLPVEPGAMRLVRFVVEGVRRSEGAATNYRWGPPVFSPYNPVLMAENEGNAGEFPMRVRLVKITSESPVVKTFRFLAPRRISFLPGQYATLEFGAMPTFGTGDEPVVRTWTLSEAANSTEGDVTLEVSVKRKKGGVISNWLHDYATLGLDVKLLGIGGEMSPFLLEKLPEKYLLVSGGIGITPNMAILRGLGARLGGRDAAAPDVLVIHQERLEEHVPFRGELYRRARTSKGRTRVVTVISGERERGGGELDGESVMIVEGRIGNELLREYVADVAERVVYLCGPAAFMNAVSKDLVDIGAAPEMIITEQFNF